MYIYIWSYGFFQPTTKSNPLNTDMNTMVGRLVDLGNGLLGCLND